MVNENVSLSNTEIHKHTHTRTQTHEVYRGSGPPTKSASTALGCHFAYALQKQVSLYGTMVAEIVLMSMRVCVRVCMFVCAYNT